MKQIDLKELLDQHGMSINNGMSTDDAITIIKNLINSGYCINQILLDNKYFSVITPSSIVELMHEYMVLQKPARISVALQSKVMQEYLSQNAFETTRLFTKALDANYPGVIKALIESVDSCFHNDEDRALDLLKGSIKYHPGAISELVKSKTIMTALVDKLKKINKPYFTLKFLKDSHSEILYFLHKEPTTRNLLEEATKSIDINTLLTLFSSKSHHFVKFLYEKQLINSKIVELIGLVKDSYTNPEALKGIMKMMKSMSNNTAEIFFKALNNLHSDTNVAEDIISTLAKFASTLESSQKVEILTDSSPKLVSLLLKNQTFIDSISTLTAKEVEKIVISTGSDHLKKDTIISLKEHTQLLDKLEDKVKVKIIATVSRKENSVYLLETLEACGLMDIDTSEKTMPKKSEAHIVQSVTDLLLGAQFGSAELITKKYTELFKDISSTKDDRGEKNLVKISKDIFKDTQAKCVFHMHKGFAHLFPQASPEESQVSTLNPDHFTSQIAYQCSFYKKVANKDDYSLQLFGSVYVDVPCTGLTTPTKPEINADTRASQVKTTSESNIHIRPDTSDSMFSFQEFFKSLSFTAAVASGFGACFTFFPEIAFTTPFIHGSIIQKVSGGKYIQCQGPFKKACTATFYTFIKIFGSSLLALGALSGYKTYFDTTKDKIGSPIGATSSSEHLGESHETPIAGETPEPAGLSGESAIEQHDGL